MKYEKKIVKDGFEYTMTVGVKYKCCDECLMTLSTCKMNMECRDLDDEYGSNYYCIKKEKIEEPVYKAGMKVVVTEEGINHPSNGSGNGWTFPIDVKAGTIAVLKSQYTAGKEIRKGIAWNTDIGWYLNEAWFKPYAEKENITMKRSCETCNNNLMLHGKPGTCNEVDCFDHNGLSKYEPYKANKEMETTKYKLVKDLTIESLQESRACRPELNKFTKKFASEYGFDGKIKWDLEFEKYAMDQNGWVEFLVDKGFLKEVKKRMMFKSGSVFTTELCGDVYKIDRLTSGNEFCMVFIGRKNRQSGSGQVSGVLDRLYGSFESLVEALGDSWETKEFTSLLSAMTHYHIDCL